MPSITSPTITAALIADPRSTATILAALRYWQRHQANSVGTSPNRIPEDDLATSGGKFDPLRRSDIDTLCETLTQSTEVTVLSISHRHGTDTTVHISLAAAREALHAWVVEWWDKEIPNRPRPEDPEEAIQMYFERVSDEGADLFPCTIEA